MYYGGQVGGLGADESFDPARSTINWWCWDESGFKDCHARQWEAARDFCQQTNSAGYTSMDVCLNKEADVRTKLNCPCSSSPPTEGGVSVKAGTYLLGFSLLTLVGIVIYRRGR